MNINDWYKLKDALKPELHIEHEWIGSKIKNSAKHAVVSKLKFDFSFIYSALWTIEIVAKKKKKI